MRASEFITESEALATDVARAMPSTYVIPELSNQDPYMQYRFGVALAGARGAKARASEGDKSNFDDSSAWGENLIVTSYDPDVGSQIDQALKTIGKKGKKLISTSKSEESPDVPKQSPVQAFKGWK